jgi:hypothetical protein
LTTDHTLPARTAPFFEEWRGFQNRAEFI